jgi:hypothetical protein
MAWTEPKKCVITLIINLLNKFGPSPELPQILKHRVMYTDPCSTNMAYGRLNDPLISQQD